MIPHPMLITLLALQGAIVLLTMFAVPPFLAVLARWNPASAGRPQLLLESRLETGFLLLGRARAVSWISLAIWVVAVSHSLPGVIPGAMCGTGVLQAMSGAGSRALFLSGALVAVLHFWGVAARLDRSVPVASLTPSVARLGLLAATFAILAFSASLVAAGSLDTARPVDCCAVVYDEVRNLSEDMGKVSLPVTFWVVMAGAFGTVLAGLSALFLAGSRLAGSWAVAAVAVTSLVFVPAAYLSLVDSLSAYHYGVLAHHCPWCLFLGIHHFAGWPMFGSLGIILLEGPVPWVGRRLARGSRHLDLAVGIRSRQAILRMLVALLLFAVLAGLPPIAWRLRHGVWMH
jgi:hypothetical protein